MNLDLQIWMDVLLRAGVVAEVCRVHEHGYTEQKNHRKKERKRKRTFRHKVEFQASGSDSGRILQSDQEDQMNNGDPLDIGLRREYQGQSPEKRRSVEANELPGSATKPVKRRRQMEVAVSQPKR